MVVHIRESNQRCPPGLERATIGEAIPKPGLLVGRHGHRNLDAKLGVVRGLLERAKS
jgi:hypothetical protein